MGHSAHQGVSPDTQKLVYTGKAAQNHPVIYLYMPRQACVIGEHRIVAHDTIMRDVYVGHQQVTVSDTGIGSARPGTAVQRTAFTDDVVVTNFQPRFLAFELFVSRIFTHRGELINDVSFTNTGIGFNHYMRSHLGAGTNLNVGTDYA